MNVYLGIILRTLIAVVCLRELGAAALTRMTRNYWRVRNRLADTLSMLEVFRSAEQRLQDKDIVIADLLSQVNEYRRRELLLEGAATNIAADLEIERRPRHVERVVRGPYVSIEPVTGEEEIVS
jgi:hypothetical protein